MSGWYVVYLIVIFLNSILTNSMGYGIGTWQYWAWFALIVLAYIAGNNNI